ncbi:hypothetical protein Efla_006028 [Eimeria flavescens]
MGMTSEISWCYGKLWLSAQAEEMMFFFDCRRRRVLMPFGVKWAWVYLAHAWVPGRSLFMRLYDRSFQYTFGKTPDDFRALFADAPWAMLVSVAPDRAACPDTIRQSQFAGRGRAGAFHQESDDCVTGGTSCACEQREANLYGQLEEEIVRLCWLLDPDVFAHVAANARLRGSRFAVAPLGTLESNAQVVKGVQLMLTRAPAREEFGA